MKPRVRDRLTECVAVKAAPEVAELPEVSAYLEATPDLSSPPGIGLEWPLMAGWSGRGKEAGGRDNREWRMDEREEWPGTAEDEGRR
jgi:hypothetical protein